MLGSEEREGEWYREPQSAVTITGESEVEVDEVMKGKRAGAGLLVQSKAETLQVNGDVCGGRGGELGRRLEAWLVTTSTTPQTWEAKEEGYEAEVEGWDMTL
jgi:hypothetical protein